MTRKPSARELDTDGGAPYRDRASKRKESAREEDERIVASAGPWISERGYVTKTGGWFNPIAAYEATEALARIANRITRERKGRSK